MEYVALIGAWIFVIGLVGIVAGWLYMLGVMVYERDWWYFVPFFFGTCFIVGLILIILVAAKQSS